MANNAVDLAMVYVFIKKLVTPFDKWPAFQQGIIDRNGKVLRKKRQLTHAVDIKAWTYMDILVANIKKVIAKAPGGQSRLATAGAAVLLLKEQPDIENEEYVAARFQQLMEEVAAANAVGNAAIDGIGVGPDGEPGVNRKKKKKTVMSKMVRRIDPLAKVEKDG